MNIRPATLNDALSIQTLLIQMGYPQKVEQVEKRINAYQIQNHHLMIAEKDGAVVGVIAFVFYEHLLKDGRCCRIDTLVIDQENRGEGVGESLVKYAEQMTVDQSGITMDLYTLERRRNTGTHNFYARLGFKDQVQRAYTYFTKENDEIGK